MSHSRRGWCLCPLLLRRCVFHRSVQDQLGAEDLLISESLTTKTPYHRYLRRARFERYAGEIEVSWVLREDNLTIAGLVFSPVETGAEAP